MKTYNNKYYIKRIVCIINIFLIVVLICFLKLNSNRDAEFLETMRSINKSEIEQKIAIKEEVMLCYDQLETVVIEVLPGIVCWGDSLTAGAGGDGVTYPQVLKENISEKLLSRFDPEIVAEKIGGGYNGTIAGLRYYSLSDVEVINRGVGGEDTNTILGRNGAIPFVVAENFIIPETKEPTEIALKSSNGKHVAPLRQGKSGMNSVTISGIEGVISIEQESDLSQTYMYYFKRSSMGESKQVDAGTTVYTDGSKQYLDYIPIVFIGQNGGYSDLNELVAQQRAIISHQNLGEKNSGKFLIIGLHTGTAASRAELEKRMLDEYGRQYINLREYMSKNALKDAGLEATEKDLERMQQGMTPESLLSDNVHFNAMGYELLGDLIYERMDELGYFDEIRDAISAVMN